jgi:hypothetical protein
MAADDGHVSRAMSSKADLGAFDKTVEAELWHYRDLESRNLNLPCDTVEVRPRRGNGQLAA